MKDHALQYFMHDGPSAFRFELAGDLNSEGARRLDQDWRAASSLMGGRKTCKRVVGKQKTGDRELIVDITFVTAADEEGRALLARWHADGAQLIAESEDSRELAEAILGEPLLESAPSPADVSGHTWLPFRTSLWAPALRLILFLAVLFPLQTRAATLKPETIAAWDAYVQSANAALQDRVGPGHEFLWSRENSQRLAEVHNGAIAVAPAPGPNPRKVPGGLIHHWIGAAFLPRARLDDILEVTRDYDRYKEFYSPSVVESKVLESKLNINNAPNEEAIDRFSMLLVDHAFFLKTALDADYLAVNVRLDDHRFYSVSKTTRVQEIEDYGQPGEHRMPTGEGGGYIWRLFSIARLEETNEGVFIELETIALSRDIPGAARLFVDPIVRRVSRNSMLISMRQTSDAVRGSSTPGAKTANFSPNGKHSSPLPATINRAASFAPLQ